MTASRTNELTRHTRILENVFCFLQPTFSDLVKDFEEIMDVLRTEVPPASSSTCNPHSPSAAASSDTLVLRPSTEFQRVRDVLLDIRKGQICYIYRPPVPLELDVLDVGYIRPSDAKFVRVDNYREHLLLNPREVPEPILSGAGDYESTVLEDHPGMLR